ncbi:MAG: hypothetical protein WBG71_03005 [Leeuwenhoekiella sp.]
MRLNPDDKALIITCSAAALLLLAFMFVSVPAYHDVAEEEFIPIPVLEEIPEEEPEEKELTETQQQEQKITHKVSNSDNLQNEARRFFREQAKAREKYLTSEDATAPEVDAGDDGELPDYKKRIADLRKQAANRPESAEEAPVKKLVEKAAYNKSTVSFQLRDRDAIRIPNPVYTCDATGKITINITVSAQGGVTKMTFNKAASTTTNGCLIDQAMSYAERAIFTSSSRESQLGSISFLFQG